MIEFFASARAFRSDVFAFSESCVVCLIKLFLASCEGFGSGILIVTGPSWIGFRPKGDDWIAAEIEADLAESWGVTIKEVESLIEMVASEERGTPPFFDFVPGFATLIKSSMADNCFLASLLQVH